MTTEQVKQESKNAVVIPVKYLMGTKAFHLLGDLSRKEEDLFVTGKETEQYYIGSWVTDFVFVNACFPKETSRELTKEEIEKYK